MSNPDHHTNSNGDEPLLVVEDLKTHYPITEGFLRRETGRIRAVDGVSFTINRGEVFGLVGESGCGKSTTAESIIRLEEPTAGTVQFDGQAISELTGQALRSFRRRAQLVVQDPNEAFSPRMTIGEAVAEPLRLHGMDDASHRRRLVEDLLERVGLSATDTDRYPHEFSGGEKQRISIARALILNPDLIVADEPTSALDNRVEADVLSLLDEIRREFGISVLLISHDLDIVRRFCDRLAVMYLGEIVEKGPVDTVLGSPAHPYTRVLLESVPSLDPSDQTLARPLTNTVPDPSEPPEGCRFHPRCPEIIPPEHVTLDRDCWRAVAEFHFTLQMGELPETVAEGNGDAAAVRKAFDLPQPLSDDRAETAIETASNAVADGNTERANSVLKEAFPTVCEREVPPEYSVDGKLAKCHLHNEASDTDLL